MSTKWAEIADPRIPAREFAQAVLSERLEAVETLLPRAAYHYSDDIEHVHQLRVSCRRAAAALRAFTPLMSEKPKKLKLWLGKIRDAAGPARDIDVLISRYCKEKAGAVSDYALPRLRKQRINVQKPLVKVAKRANSGKFDDAITQEIRLLESAKEKPTVAKYGQKAVRLAYLPFARLALLENPSSAKLHQLRIAGKRLRYSLELFHGLSPRSIDSAYAIVEELQTRLGDINDHATAQKLYQSWLAAMPADALAAELAERVVQEHKAFVRLSTQFLRWWSPKRITEIHKVFTQFCG